MPELLHPGVYVQEIPPAVRPIEGVGTSTAAFIGVADKGPVPGSLLPTGSKARPIMVTSLTEFTRVFGGFRQDSFLTYAVTVQTGTPIGVLIRVAGTARFRCERGLQTRKFRRWFTLRRQWLRPIPSEKLRSRVSRHMILCMRSIYRPCSNRREHQRDNQNCNLHS